MCIYTICLENMQFVGFHGCREDEKIKGNVFTVDFEASYRGIAGETDALEDALNYGAIYRVIASVMRGERVNLLETLVHRILSEVQGAFPQILTMKVTVSKHNPPVDGPCSRSSVSAVWPEAFGEPETGEMQKVGQMQQAGEKE